MSTWTIPGQGWSRYIFASSASFGCLFPHRGLCFTCMWWPYFTKDLERTIADLPNFFWTFLFSTLLHCHPSWASFLDILVPSPQHLNPDRFHLALPPWAVTCNSLQSVLWGNHSAHKNCFPSLTGYNPALPDNQPLKIIVYYSSHPPRL